MKKFVLLIIAVVAFCSFDLAAQEELVVNAVKNAVVVLRQDYQFVDEDEGEVRNYGDKEYWGRVYTLGARIGDDKLLLGTDGVKPWNKESYSKHDRFQPKVSSSAYRTIDMPEFESFDFDEDDVEEVSNSRMFLVPGPDMAGLTLKGTEGYTKCYVLWVYTSAPMNEYNESQTLYFDLQPVSLKFNDDMAQYSVPEAPQNALGGLILHAVTTDNGSVVFAVCGNCQTIGGRWRGVSVDSSVEQSPSL